MLSFRLNLCPPSGVPCPPTLTLPCRYNFYLSRPFHWFHIPTSPGPSSACWKKKPPTPMHYILIIKPTKCKFQIYFWNMFRTAFLSIIRSLILSHRLSWLLSEICAFHWFYNKNIVHRRIYHDARSPECQIRPCTYIRLLTI
jgi:hypothetical protein